MKKKIFIIPIILSITLLSSCSTPHQKDWHIATIDLADKYFPKYFDAIESSLKRNNFIYEKEYNENYYFELFKEYCYTYYISDLIFFSVKFQYEITDTYYSRIYFLLNYESTNADDILNISLNYINVMEDTIKFCSNYFKDSNQKYKIFYDNLVEKCKKKGIPKNDFFTKEETEFTILKPLILRSVYIGSSSSSKNYYVQMGLRDYLNDANIWDNNF